MSNDKYWKRLFTGIAESGKFWQQQFHNVRRNIGPIR